MFVNNSNTIFFLNYTLLLNSTASINSSTDNISEDDNIDSIMSLLILFGILYFLVIVCMCSICYHHRKNNTIYIIDIESNNNQTKSNV